MGLLLTTKGPRTDAAQPTKYEYYAADHADCTIEPLACSWRKGDLWKVTDGAGRVTESLGYDGAGRVLSTKAANGVITEFEYDPRGRLTRRATRASN